MNPNVDDNILDNEKEITSMVDEISSEEDETETETEIENGKINNSSNTNTIINIQGEPNNVVYRKPRKERRRIPFINEFAKKRVYITTIISLLILFLVDILSYLFFNLLLNNKKITLKEVLENDNRTTKSVVFLIIYECIIKPILEEIVFRKLVFRVVKKLSKILAFILSSFLFAFAYFDCNFVILWNEFYNFPAYFLKGIILAETYDYDGYLLASILSNLLYSTISTLLQLI